ncbi:ABC transporter substrate-binding protein [Spirochaetia bacterium]|nr:ABC transporter substrate-binding protein [Spirochaetia bacterium]
MKKKFGLFCCALVMVVLAGCGKKAAPFGTAEYKTVLNVAVMQESPSLDLHKNSSLIARQIASGTVWEKLLTLNARSEVVPELCERFEMSGDARTFTFYLRKGVKFHDGSVMNADDVAASMNRWINGFSVMREIAGPSRFEKIDGSTVRITFNHPAVSFPEVIAGANQSALITTAAACVDEDAKGFLKQNIGTGPFKFVEWKLNQYILLEKFADYVPYGDSSKPIDGWAGYKAPGVEQIYFRVVPEDLTRIAGLETGQYDINYNLGTYDMPRIAAMGDEVEMVRYQAGTVAFVFDKREGPASDLYFRRAVNAVIDIDDILESVYGEFYEGGASYMDDTQPYWKSLAGSEHYNQKNPGLAKEYLAKSNYRGESFVILTTTMGNMEASALVMQQQLASVGINVKITSVDWATMMAYANDPLRFDIYTTSFSSVPLPSLKLYFAPTYAGWSDDPALQQYLSALNAATSRDEARQIWDTLQAYSWEYLPILNLGHYIAASAWNKKVENVTVYNGLYFWNTRVRK